MNKALVSLTFGCIVAYALGEICWQKSSSKGDPVLTAGPVVSQDHGILLFASLSGLMAFDAMDGSKVWEKRNYAQYKYKFVGESQGFLVVAEPGDDKSPFEFMSLHPKNGAAIWKTQHPYISIGALPRYAVEGGLMVAGGGASGPAITAGYTAIDTATGATKIAAPLPFRSSWSKPLDCRWFTMAIAPHSRDGLIALNVEEGSRRCQAQWAVIDSASKKTLWTREARSGPPVIGFADASGRSMLVVSELVGWNASMVAYHAHTGAVLWNTTLQTRYRAFRVLSCGLIWTHSGVLRPEDGSIAYMPQGVHVDVAHDETPPGRDHGLTARGSTNGSGSLEDVYLEAGAIVSRDCVSGERKWQAMLPSSAQAGFWQQPAALGSHSSGNTCQADAVAVSFGETGGWHGVPVRHYSKAVAVSRDSQLLV